MKRKKYSPEFKREAIELVRRSGASCRQVNRPGFRGGLNS